MTLYEEYKNGLNIVDYCERAYKNLKIAIMLTADEEDLYDERDIKFTFESLIITGDLGFVSEKNGARKLLRDTFRTKEDYIDPYFTNMMKDYIYLNISEFLRIYSVRSKSLNREESRTIKSMDVINSDLEFLDCATVTGPVRPNNEDFVCATTSPLNPDYKLLVVCDGSGGHNNGEIASELVSSEIVKWFNNYDFSSDFDNVKEEITNVLKESKELIRQETFLSGTTVTFAIVGENNTFIGNVGDSRTYTIKDGVLKQITKDDSDVWDEFYGCEPQKLTKDDLRFLINNFIIYDGIDDMPYAFNLQSYIIPNDDYDGVISFSDGVTDILSDETIMRIFKNSEKSKLLDRLLYEACYGDFDIPRDDCDEVMCPPRPGKDNASIALYLKLK